jgi:hypothetical protein
MTRKGAVDQESANCALPAFVLSNFGCQAMLAGLINGWPCPCQLAPRVTTYVGLPLGEFSFCQILRLSLPESAMMVSLPTTE